MEKLKQILGVWFPTILAVITALVNQYLIPVLTSVEPRWSWTAFALVGVTALINALKQDTNPIKHWDSTLAGVIGAVLVWVAESLGKDPVILDWKGLTVVLLPILIGAMSRGLGKSYTAPEGGT